MQTGHFDAAIKKTKTELMEEIFRLQEYAEDLEADNNLLREELIKTKTRLYFFTKMFGKFKA